MLQIAIPNKGALSEDAVRLLKEAGYKCSRYGRELIVHDTENDVDFIFLRPRDIAVYVGNGIVDLGITGRDLTVDSKAEVAELLPLEFGKSRFCYAVPKNSGLTPDKFDGLRIATSYPEIVARDMAKRNFNVKIVKLDGAVEISVKLGVADCIADVVESGRTLVEAGLEITGEPILHSEALLIAGTEDVANLPAVKKLIARLRGILVARSYAMIEYDIEKSKLKTCCQITPGIESPTVSPLDNPDWVAVKAMIGKKEINSVMDKLYAEGARGIIVTALSSCRL